MGKKKPVPVPLQQLSLFDESTLQGMEHKAKKVAPSAAAGRETVRTVWGNFQTTPALDDIMRDNGYSSFEQFLNGDEPK